MQNHPLLFSSDSPDILRTKIVCTIGPNSSSRDEILKLIHSGMSICRLNLAHCNHEFSKTIIQTVRDLTNEIDTEAHVGIWLDINGPKVRTGKLANNEPVYLKRGQEFSFINDLSIIGDNTQIATTYTKELLEVGDKIAVEDGLLLFTVTERLPNGVKTIIENSGLLSPNKGVNFPLKRLEDLPALSDKDKLDLKFAMEQHVDYVSVSCIRDIDDVEETRLLLGNSSLKLLAKIENQSGMDNYEAILKMSDGIVIDRGYLGAEVDVEIVAIAQKKMVALANAAGKPILIANQMLESMRSSPRPTRSEAADITNAVMDGVDGLVLSAETAIGDYVHESVAMMRRIAFLAEHNTNYLEYQVKTMRNVPKPLNTSESIASSAVVTSKQIDAAVIIVITEGGGTARLVAKYRPQIPVVAATMVKQTASQLNLHFGLVPYYHTGAAETVIQDTIKFAVDLGFCHPGQTAVITSGQIVGFLEGIKIVFIKITTGTTTKMQIVTIE